MDEKEKKDMKYCLDILLSFAESYNERYSSDDNIAEVLDIYKKYFG